MQVVSICEIMDQHEDAIYGGLDPYSEEGYKAFFSWCQANGYYFYSAVREHFFIFEAEADAAAAGFNKVIVEDLS